MTAARRLNRAAGTLAVSVLADSAIEHYRGSFKNKAMFTPLIVSALTLATSMHGTADSRPVAHGLRDAIYALAAATGLIGTGFHLYNVGKKTGGFSWQNLFYGAPLGAPFAILLSGLIGFCSERVRDTSRWKIPTIFKLPAGRTMAAVISAGLLGTTGEAGLLHFRGAFHNPLMTLPVTLPPVGALLMASAAAGPPGRDLWFTRWWMRLLTAMGFAGVGAARLRRFPQHGRLAQLEPERAERTADSGAAELCRTGARRARRARPDGRSSRCLSKSRHACLRAAFRTMTSCRSGCRRPGTRRRAKSSHAGSPSAASRNSSPPTSFRRFRRWPRGSCRNRRPARRFRWPRWSTISCINTRKTAIGTPECRAKPKRGGVDCKRSTRRPSTPSAPASASFAARTRMLCSRACKTAN